MCDKLFRNFITRTKYTKYIFYFYTLILVGNVSMCIEIHRCWINRYVHICMSSIKNWIRNKMYVYVCVNYTRIHIYLQSVLVIVQYASTEASVGFALFSIFLFLSFFRYRLCYRKKQTRIGSLFPGFLSSVI